MKKTLKIIAIVFAILFIWAGVMQYNDPDAMRWYTIYGMGAFASILFAFDRLKITWALVLLVFYVGFAVFNWPAKFEGFTIGEGDIVNIEKGREVGGLLILGLAMLIYSISILFRKKS